MKMKRTRTRVYQSPHNIINSSIHTFQPSPWDFHKMEKLHPAPPMTHEQNEAYHRARVTIMAKHFGWKEWMLEDYGVENPKKGTV